MKIRLTMLNTMASNDFEQALDQFVDWGLEVVDLKNGIYGQAIENLTEAIAVKAAQEMQKRGLKAYCLSTELFHDDVEKGEDYFRQHYLNYVDEVVEVAKYFHPNMIRLLSARMENQEGQDKIEHISRHYPWLITLYQEAIDRITEAGFMVTIENEAHRNILTNPEEIISFFTLLDRPECVHFTYDVQNLWQMGTSPTIEVYEQLRPLIGFLHLKGGKRGNSGNELKWKSSLEEADWPVAEIVRLAIEDQVSPVICLNPSHGQRREGYVDRDIYVQDLKYVTKLIANREEAHDIPKRFHN